MPGDALDEEEDGSPRDPPYEGEHDLWLVRPYSLWKGEYSFFKVVDSNWTNNPPPPLKDIRFFSVCTQELDSITNTWQKVWSIVPTSWMCSKFLNLLWPPHEYKVSGKRPIDWGPSTFQRHFNPEAHWIEYTILYLLNRDHPVRHHTAILASKKAQAGVPYEEIVQLLDSDAEQPLGKTPDGLSARQALKRKRAEESSKNDGPKGADAEQEIHHLSSLNVSQASDGDEETPLQSELLSSLNRPNQHSESTIMPSEPGNLPRQTQLIESPSPSVITIGPSTTVTTTSSGISHCPLSSVSTTWSGIRPDPLSSVSTTSSGISPGLLSSGSTTSSRISPGPFSSGSTTSSGISSFRGWSSSGSATSGDGFDQSSLFGATSSQLLTHAIPSIPSSSSHPTLLGNNLLGGWGMVGASTSSSLTSSRSFSMSSLLSNGDTTNNRTDASTALNMNSISSQEISDLRQFALDSRQWQTVMMTKVDAIMGMIGTLTVRDLPQRVRQNLHYHESVVEANCPGLPYDSVKTLAAMNVKLTSCRIAICLVGVLFNAYKEEDRIGKFFRAAFDHLFTDSVCNRLQWRGTPSVVDKRAGIETLSNIVAVIATASNLYLSTHNEEKLKSSRIIAMIKIARKKKSDSFRRVNKIDSITATTAMLTPRVEDLPDEDLLNKADSSIEAILDKVTCSLEKEFLEFKIPAVAGS